MHKMNGFTIIAHRPSGNHGRGTVILGVKPNRHAIYLNNGGYEYVTAMVDRLSDAEWFWGHYFSSDDALRLATQDFENR